MQPFRTHAPLTLPIGVRVRGRLRRITKVVKRTKHTKLPWELAMEKAADKAAQA